MKVSLYEITEEIKALDEMLNNDQGEISETYEELEGFITDMFAKKTDGCVNYIQSLDDDISAANTRIDEMRSFIDSRRNAIENFKKYVQICMEKTGRDKFVGEFYSIKKRKPSKVLNVVDANKLPMEYLESKTVISVLTAVIKKDLKDGKKIDGVELVNGKESLKIGIKSKKD